MSTAESIGARVKWLREEQGIGLADFARTTGMSYTAAADIEKGKRIPAGKTAMLIADALGCTLDYIYTGRTCKDCAWYEYEREYCRNLEVTMYDMDFCSYFDKEDKDG